MRGGDAISQWKNRLTTQQIDQILAVVAGFGLDYLYDDAGIPGPRIAIT
jgi:hypothetical protein